MSKAYIELRLILQLSTDKVIMPKLGKRNKAENEEEKSRSFKKYKNLHSAVESNINELEHEGLDFATTNNPQEAEKQTHTVHVF